MNPEARFPPAPSEAIGHQLNRSHWVAVTAAVASVLMSMPLILNGTPDVESYSMSIFSTIAFARNLAAGMDPWFVSAYGFGIPLPSSTWLIKFPAALPAAFGGPAVLYATVWLIGEFLFGVFIMKLSLAITPRRSIAIFALITGLLSFSNLGPTYRDDWPEHFAGWALFPACLWFVIRTLQAQTTRERLRRGAACALVLGIFAGSTHQNENVTFFSGMALVLAFFAWKRPKGVTTVMVATLIAVASASDVIVPTVEGMLAGRVNPLARRISVVPDDLTIGSYGVFLEPLPTLLTSHFARVLHFTYERQPFFGAVALLLAAAGAVSLIVRGRPALNLPPDIARVLGVGFVVYSALTLMPSFVALGLPRMWMYRDGQTVFAILCAAAALHWVASRRPALAYASVAAQLLQLFIVALPFVTRVLESKEARTFGYSRREPRLFEALRRAGMNEGSRLMLAGEVEELVKGSIPGAGITAGTDFALEHIPLINAWYRGGATPSLGGPSMDGRYGAYETLISWKRALGHLDARGLDVLGITHVLALEDDSKAMTWAEPLTRVDTVKLQGAPPIAVFRNDDAWAPVSLLPPGRLEDPPHLGSCREKTIYCRDFHAVPERLPVTMSVSTTGSTIRVSLPASHPAGQLLIVRAAGPDATATVDGRPRLVHPFLDAFGTVDIDTADHEVVISLARRRAQLLTSAGLVLLGGCLAIVVAMRDRPRRRP